MSTEDQNNTQPGDNDYGTYVRDGYKGDPYKIRSARGKQMINKVFGFDFSGGKYGGEDETYTGGQMSFQQIDRYLTSIGTNEWQDMSQEEFEDYQYLRMMAGLDESGHIGDDNLNNTVFDSIYDRTESRYLRNKVYPNILDAFELPNYVFTLYMLKKSKYADYIKSKDTVATEDSEAARTDSQDTQGKKRSKLSLEKPDPNDIVIIAQTGSTDLGIDDVEIDSLLGLDQDMKPLTISFTITEPGSVTLLDRLAECKSFCGYETDPSTIPGLFLELSFKGYSDAMEDRDQGGEPMKVPFGMLRGQEGGNSEYALTDAYFELGGVTFDMQISAEEGSKYNFKTYRQHTGGRDQLYLSSTKTIKGQNIAELLGGVRMDDDGQEIGYGLEGAFNKGFDELDEEIKDRKAVTNRDRELVLDISEFIENSKEVTDDAPDKKEKQTNRNADTISNSLLKDYSKLETFAKSGNITKGDNRELNWVKNGEHLWLHGGGNGPGPDGEDYFFNERSKEIQDTITVGGATGELTITEEIEKSINGVNVYTDPFIEIKLPAGIHLKDAMYLVLSLSEDFMNKATRVRNPTSMKKDQELVVDSAYIRWVNLDTDHYYDYDDYDEDKGTYSEYFVVRPVLTYNSNPNAMVFKEEFKHIQKPTVESIKAKLDSLQISKEYFYSYTGINDQVLQIDFNFDEAFAIEIPTFRRPSYAQQSIVATSSALKEEDAGKNTNSSNPIGDALADKEKASGILDSLKELSDGDLGSFAEYVGFSDEEISRLIREKNDNGTSVRGTSQPADSDQELLTDLASALSVEEVGSALLSGYTSTNPPGQGADAPQEGDETIYDLEEEYGVKSKYIYASELVFGLEGQDAAQMKDLDSRRDDAQDRARLAMGIKPKLKVIDAPDLVKEAPVEMDSIRPTAFSHLMRATTNARSHLQIDMAIRGDPYWLGNDIFYGQDQLKIEGPQYVKKSTDIFFVMEAPRRLDNDVNDEDNNTGLFDYGNINYTMSGVYQVTGLTSSFSQGLFSQQLNMFQNQQYEMSKIELLKQEDRPYTDFYNADGEYLAPYGSDFDPLERLGITGGDDT